MVDDPLQSVGFWHENEAVRGCSRRVADLRESLGPYHPEYATALNQLSLLLIMQGEADSAESFLREALEIRRVGLGENHPDYATNLSSLGGILWARGELEEAEPILRKASEIRSASLGPHHPKSVISRNSLEQLIEAKKEWEAECLSRMQRARLGFADEAFHTAASDSPSTLDETLQSVTATPSKTVEHAEPIAHMPAAELGVPQTDRKKPLTVSIKFAEHREAVISHFVDHSVSETSPSIPAPPVGSITPAPVIGPAVAASPAGDLRADSIEKTEIHDFTPRLSELAVEFDRLGQKLVVAGRALLGEGTVPSESLIHDCQECRASYGETVALAVSDGKRYGLTPSHDTTTSLEELSRFVESLGESVRKFQEKQQRRLGALDVLKRIATLRSLADPQFAPLVRCRSQAEALAKAINLGQHLGPTLTKFVNDLADGDHPYCAILRLIEADPDMTDLEWSSWYETVASAFGSQLAVAVGRRRIVLTH